MKKDYALLILILIRLIFFGCAAQNQQSYKYTEPPGKYDGKYRNEYRDIIITMNIKNNVINGYLQVKSLSSEYRIPINGNITGDKFQINYIHHPDIRMGFQMEVTSASPRRIDFWLYDDNKKRYSLYVLKQ
jgi:hypothetical protein